MEDRNVGRMKIIDKSDIEEEKKEELPYGTIVYCRGTEGTGSFYGIVYEEGVLELPYGSNAYIYTREGIHLGDMISYWRIERVCKNVKLIINNSEVL